MNVSFIVHRPYHLLRSISAVLDLRKDYSFHSKLIILDTPSDFKAKYTKTVSYHQDYDLDKVFDEIVFISRLGEPSIFDFFRFREFYNQMVVKASKLLEGSKIDYHFIFSDKEKSVEILSLFIKEKLGSKVFLIDEGVVSYYRKSHLFKFIIKKTLVKLLNYKYVSDTIYYGESQFVDAAILNYPSISTIRNHKLTLPPLEIEKIRDFYKGELPKPGVKYLIYASNILGDLHNVRWEDEKKLIYRLLEACENHNYRLLIKPHPVEEASKYDELRESVEILGKSIPLELLFEKQNIFISISSSVLINAHLCGIRAVDMSFLVGLQIENELFEKIGLSKVESFDEIFQFEKVSSASAHRPESFSELMRTHLVKQ